MKRILLLPTDEPLKQDDYVGRLYDRINELRSQLVLRTVSTPQWSNTRWSYKEAQNSIKRKMDDETNHERRTDENQNLEEKWIHLHFKIQMDGLWIKSLWIALFMGNITKYTDELPDKWWYDIAYNGEYIIDYMQFILWRLTSTKKWINYDKYKVKNKCRWC